MDFARCKRVRRGPTSKGASLPERLPASSRQASSSGPLSSSEELEEDGDDESYGCRSTTGGHIYALTEASASGFPLGARVLLRKKFWVRIPSELLLSTFLHVMQLTFTYQVAA